MRPPAFGARHLDPGPPENRSHALAPTHSASMQPRSAQTRQQAHWSRPSSGRNQAARLAPSTSRRTASARDRASSPFGHSHTRSPGPHQRPVICRPSSPSCRSSRAKPSTVKRRPGLPSQKRGLCPHGDAQEARPRPRGSAACRARSLRHRPSVARPRPSSADRPRPSILFSPRGEATNIAQSRRTPFGSIALGPWPSSVRLDRHADRLDHPPSHPHSSRLAPSPGRPLYLPLENPHFLTLRASHSPIANIRNVFIQVLID
jgi:hypothetical protein